VISSHSRRRLQPPVPARFWNTAKGKGLVLFCQVGRDGPHRSRTRPPRRLAEEPRPVFAAWTPAQAEGRGTKGRGARGEQRGATRHSHPPLATRQVALCRRSCRGRATWRSGLRRGQLRRRQLSAGQVLVVGPGGGEKLAASRVDIAAFLKAAATCWPIGLDRVRGQRLSAFQGDDEEGEHIAAFFDPPRRDFLCWAGVGPAGTSTTATRER